MGKIKSAIITAIVLAAVFVLAFFSLVSFPLAGSDGVQGYNSFIRKIHLGSDFAGEASAVLYPEGVISAADYSLAIPDDEAKREEYVGKYTKYGSVYVENDAIIDGADKFRSQVEQDAAVLNYRLSKKGYTSYSVSVEDGYAIRVAVPTNYTYAAYNENLRYSDSDLRSEELNAVTQTIQFLAYDGELSLRNTAAGSFYDKELGAYMLTPLKENPADYFKSVKKYGIGGNYAVRLNLTGHGRSEFKDISSSVMNTTDDANIRFYIGDKQLIQLSCTSVIDSKNFLIQVNDEALAEEYAIVLDSVVNGKILHFDYGTDENLTVVYSTANLGEKAPVYLGAVLLAIVLAAVIFSVVRYKKLGLVNSLSVIIFSLALICAMMIIGIQLTMLGAFAAVCGLALLMGSNIAAFEAVRRETRKGKTIQSSVKSGYKSVLSTILELHIVLLVVSLILTLVCVGEAAACGFIFFICTIASYILHWFTRFMWYVISSPVKDKWSFGGYKREVFDE